MQRYFNSHHNFQTKIQKMGFGLHDLLPHFVLLGLHMFFCFCVGWVVNSFLGGKGVS